MKFALALLAFGAQAVKLQDADLSSRGERIARIIDSNNDEIVSGDELHELIDIIVDLEYLDEETAAPAHEEIEELVAVGDIPATFEELDAELAEMDDEELEELDEAFTAIEDMVLTEAGKMVFDELDQDDNGAVDFDEFTDVLEFIEEEEGLDEDEVEELVDGFYEIAGEDGVVDGDEFFYAMGAAIADDPELREELLDDIVDFIDELQEEAMEESD